MLSHLLGKGVDFLSRHLNVMVYSFVCSFPHMDLNKIRRNNDNIRKDFTIIVTTSLWPLWDMDHIGLCYAISRSLSLICVRDLSDE